MICANPNCRAVDGIELHHLYARSEGCPDDLVVPLCHVCHGRAHGYSRRLNINDIVRSRLREKKLSGGRTGGMPYGWRLVGGAGKQLEPDPAEQVVVEMARKLRAAGNTLADICGTLAERGHLSRVGKPFVASQIIRMCDGLDARAEIARIQEVRRQEARAAKENARQIEEEVSGPVRLTIETQDGPRPAIAVPIGLGWWNVTSGPYSLEDVRATRLNLAPEVEARLLPLGVVKVHSLGSRVARKMRCAA